MSTTIERVARSWKLSLEAANKSPRTIEVYGDSIARLVEWLAANDRPNTIEAVGRADVEGFIADQLARFKPSTASVRFRSLRTFFSWCEREDEIERSPMTNLTPPIVPEQPVPVLTEVELRRLLKSCEGKSYEDRRDNAIMRLLYDTGCRRAELAGLALDDIDLDQRWIRVMGKGRRPRAIPFGASTARALDRYLRERDRHPMAHLDAVWLGRRGKLGADGVRQLLERRGEQAGVVDVHAHRFRHSFAHAFLADGGGETDLMLLTGWKSRQMLNRYAASTAAERARANYRAPGDRL